MAGSLAEPSSEQMDAAFAKYGSGAPERDEALTSAPGREENAEEVLANFDRVAVERGYMEKPKPAPETAEPSEKPLDFDHDLFAQHGTDLRELAGILEENPGFADLIGSEPARSPEEMARKVRTVLELNEGRQARSALADERSEALLEEALATLDESEEHWERVRAAQELAAVAPERLGEFLAEWQETDPVEAHDFVARREQQELAARQNLGALQFTLATYGQAKEAAERGAEIDAAFQDEIAKVSASLNPKGKDEFGPLFGAALQELVASEQIDSAEIARGVTRAAFQQAREIHRARQEAEILTGIDEYIARQEAISQQLSGRPVEAFNEAETQARNLNQRFDEGRERIAQAAVDAVIPRPKPAWLEGFDKLASTRYS